MLPQQILHIFWFTSALFWNTSKAVYNRMLGWDKGLELAWTYWRNFRTFGAGTL